MLLLLIDCTPEDRHEEADKRRVGSCDVLHHYHQTDQGWLGVGEAKCLKKDSVLMYLSSFLWNWRLFSDRIHVSQLERKPSRESKDVLYEGRNERVNVVLLCIMVYVRTYIYDVIQFE